MEVRPVVEGIVVAVVAVAWGGWDVEHVAFGAYLASVALTVYLGMCTFLAWKDLTDAWATYRLYRPGQPTTRTVGHYVSYLGYTFRDLVVTLPLSLAVLCRAGILEWAYLTRPWADVSVAREATVLVLQYTVQKMWNAGVHYVLHHRLLYRHIHKVHHTQPKELVATAAWKESYGEFLVMELLGNFILGPMLFPMHWVTMATSFAYVGFGAAVDHAGFGPGAGFLGDGEYHFLHHKLTHVNYAEFELLDFVTGTHHSQMPSKLKTKASAGS